MALENIHKIFENDVVTKTNRKLQAFNQLKFKKKWMTEKKTKNSILETLHNRHYNITKVNRAL